MKKWIDSNYHYMVPEVDGSSTVDADLSDFVADVKRGVEFLGAKCATPVVLGPVTIVRLASFATTFVPFQNPEALLGALLPVYTQLFKDLKALGVVEVQLHEPALGFDEAGLLPLFKKAYPSIFHVGGPAINMVSFFEDIGHEQYKWLTSLDEVSIISLDFTRGDNLALVEKYGFPSAKTLGFGIIDGRNVWKVDPRSTEDCLRKLADKGATAIRVQPSSSLQFVPWDLASEKDILSQPGVGQVLSFAVQKIAEVALVAKVARGEATLGDHKAAWSAYRAMLVGDKSVSDRVGECFLMIRRKRYHKTFRPNP